MIRLVYSPQWFYGKDIAIDIISGIVLILISFFALQYYRIERKNKNFLFLAGAFFLMAVSFTFKILTNFTIYYNIPQTRQIGALTLTYNIVKSTDTLFVVGYFMQRLLMLVGLTLLYTLYQRRRSRADTMLLIYLLVISTYFSDQAYQVFHFTSLLLLSLVTYHYSKKEVQRKAKGNLLLLWSFGTISASNVPFMFAPANLIWYVAAEIVQLAGYLLLLWTFIKVLTHGKKKKPS